jgi:hypothetical protein
MQIKLAISNPDPRPARLAPNYQQHYSPMEALEGYKRAANAHGWQVSSVFSFSFSVSARRYGANALHFHFLLRRSRLDWRGWCGKFTLGRMNVDGEG